MTASLSLLEIKCVAIAVLFVVALVCGLLPLMISLLLARTVHASQRQKRYLNYVTCFSGGVFLASAILVLLPEAREAAESYLEEVGLETPFPLTEFLTGVGFFLILVAEQIGASLSRHLHRKRQNNPGTNSIPAVGENNPAVDLEQDGTERPDAFKKEIDTKNDLRDIHVQDTSESANATQEGHSCSNRLQIAVERTIDVKEITKPLDTSSGNIASNNSSLNSSTEFEEESDSVEEAEIPKFSKIRTFILATALSLHLVFDGIALGLLTSGSTAWGLLVALVLHKTVVSFSVGMFLRDIYTKRRYIVATVAAFASVSPCGVAIGIGIRSQTDSHIKDILSAILQGLASGTFLYVTFFEILQKEFSGHSANLRRSLACLAGFIAVAAIKFAVKEEEP